MKTTKTTPPTPAGSRRHTLKTLAISGAIIGTSSLPARWTRPVVDSIMLPAHAATTDNSGSLPGGAPTPGPTTTSSPCTVNCEIEVNMHWQFASSENTQYRGIVLEVVTPGGTRISPDGAQRGTCLELKNHSAPDEIGSAKVGTITPGKVAPGRYQIFVNSKSGSGGSVNVSVNASACGQNDSAGFSTSDSYMYNFGSINVSSGGTSTVRIDG